MVLYKHPAHLVKTFNYLREHNFWKYDENTVIVIEDLAIIDDMVHVYYSTMKKIENEKENRWYVNNKNKILVLKFTSIVTVDMLLTKVNMKLHKYYTWEDWD